MAFSQQQQIDPSDIKLLRLFVAVVECGGFSGAQAQLNVGASTISTQMAALECRLGMRLCNRGRVGFSVTDKGRRVYAAAKRLENAIDEIRCDIGELRGKLIGELNIGVVGSTITCRDFKLDDSIALFSKRDHAVHLKMHTLDPVVIEKKILDGNIQIGIGDFFNLVPSLSYEKLFCERHNLYCSVRHPLYSRAPSRLRGEDIRKAHYVTTGYLPPRRAALPTKLTAIATASDMEAMLIMIRSGAFIGHLPEHYAESYVLDGELRSLMPEVFGFVSEFKFVIRRGLDNTSAVKTFVDDLRFAHGMTTGNAVGGASAG